MVKLSSNNNKHIQLMDKMDKINETMDFRIIY